jgi:RimJ/RimL family protein N-acetyltransferase
VIAVPELVTQRLLLRGFAARDFEPYAAMMADPDVARYLGDGRPLSRAEAWRQLAYIVGHWALRGFGLWAVEERATGALVGRIGLLEPEGWPGFELAYTLARPAWRRGFAREAAAAALAYARQTLGRDEVISIIRPDNAASIRVARALGAGPDATIEFFGSPAVIYRYPPRASAMGTARPVDTDPRQPEVEIRPLGPADAEEFQAIRLRGLRESPEAFGSTYDEDVELPLDVVAARLERASPPAARVVIGAYDGGRLVGTVACVQHGKVKARHKAVIWGMYVAPEARGRGLGRRLLGRVIDEAREWPGVEWLTLTVVERARAARALYVAAGFRPFGREPDGLRQGNERDTVEYLALALREPPERERSV